MKDGIPFLIYKLLYENKISVDKTELAFQIASHPTYPSLHSITGVLDHFNIDNLVLDIPKNEETLTQLPKTFLAQINTVEGKEFVVAINKGLNYQLINSSKSNSTVSLIEFLNQFTGIIVGVEKTEHTDESKNSNQVFKKALVILTALLSIGFLFALKPNTTSLLFFATSMLGLVISIAIKKQELGENTILGNAFCSGDSEKKDCDAVLSSNKATLIGDFKLSDLSTIYFLWLSISIFSLIVLKQNLSVVYIIVFLALPMTIYSIYNQAFVIKKWCLLCLSIVGLLWSQIALSIIENNTLNLLSITWIQLIMASLFFLITLTLYFQYLSQIDALNSLKKIKIDFFKFKRNFTLFNSLLQQSKTIDTSINHNLSEIAFGNLESKLQITIITNPFCSFCKSVHDQVEDIYRKYPKKVKLQVLFNVNPKNKENKNTKVITRLLELYQNNGLKTFMNAMHIIYTNQDEKIWLDEFGECSNLDYYCNILEQQYTWCLDNNINLTPKILINGKSYPKEYDRSDLILFIEDLLENLCLETKGLQLTT